MPVGPVRTRSPAAASARWLSVASSAAPDRCRTHGHALRWRRRRPHRRRPSGRRRRRSRRRAGGRARPRARAPPRARGAGIGRRRRRVGRGPWSRPRPRSRSAGPGARGEGAPRAPARPPRRPRRAAPRGPPSGSRAPAPRRPRRQRRPGSRRSRRCAPAPARDRPRFTVSRAAPRHAPEQRAREPLAGTSSGATWRASTAAASANVVGSATVGPEAMVARSSPTTSESTSVQSARGPGRRAREPPALDARAVLPHGVQRRDVRAAEEERPGDGLLVGERRAPRPAPRGAPTPRRSGRRGRRSPHPRRRPRRGAARLAASPAASGTGCAPVAAATPPGHGPASPCGTTTIPPVHGVAGDRRHGAGHAERSLARPDHEHRARVRREPAAVARRERERRPPPGEMRTHAARRLDRGERRREARVRVGAEHARAHPVASPGRRRKPPIRRRP